MAPSPQPPRSGAWLVIVSALAIGAATLTPSSQPPEQSDLAAFCIVCGSLGGVDVVLNVLLFAPLGFGLAIARVRRARALMAIVAFTLIIECLQVFVVPGRDASLGDVLMNVAGGVLGFAAGLRIARLLTPSPVLARWFAAGWCALWLSLQFVASYSLTPRPPNGRYFGQIAPTLGGMSTFEGRVLAVRIDTGVIRDGELSERQSIRVRDVLRTGAVVSAKAVSTGSPPLIAPIFRIADDEQHEVLMIAQDEAALIFGVRTGADVLKLRPVRFWLSDVFRLGSGPLAPADTILIEAMHARSHVFVHWRSRRTGGQLTLAVRASQGWRLFMPLQTYVEAGLWNVLVSSAWMVLLILPLGYWVVLAGDRQDPARWRAADFAGIALLVVVLVIGLSGIPIAFGLEGASRWEWAVTATGAFLGAAFSLAVQARRAKVLATRPEDAGAC